MYCESAKKLDIYIDHKNLTYFITTKVLNSRQIKWAELFAQYKFTIHYTPERENGRADTLNRRPDYITNKKDESFAILQQNENGTLERNTHQLNVIIIKSKETTSHRQKKGKRTVYEKDVEACIRQYYNPLEFSHLGVNGMIVILKRSCYFKRIQEKVRRYIKRCEHYQKNKHATHKKYGKTKIIPLSEHPWQEITMDFITKLPKSKDPVTRIQYDSIWVVIDRLTK